ncbi:MAG: polysaccharide deacetylase family protein [Blastocatellia bacterium]|nr:polysaccharide deacetylase family protein [Blastocatellia bacterium]
MNSPVLLYHKIDRPTPDVRIRGAFTSPRRFERQMSYLVRSGYRFFSASAMAGHYLELGGFPDKCVCITFDDGWKDNYTYAFPILKKFQIPATVFVVPSCVGTTTAMVTAEGEGSREHMSEEDIREMSASGIEFGSHGMNHKLFNRIDTGEVESEVSESKNYLEDLLQQDCRVFAYPAGFFTEFSQSVVKRAGYIAAFTTVYGRADNSDVFALNRSEILHRHGYPFRFARRIRSIFPG